MNTEFDHGKLNHKSRAGSKDDSRSTSKTSPETLSDLLDHFVEATEGQDKVAISDLLDSLSSRSHGPMLLLPAIIAISPIGMIPGMSIVTGTLIILIATQMMFFTNRPWIPNRIACFEFTRNNSKLALTKRTRG